MARTRLFTNWDDVPVVMDLPLAARIVGVSYEVLKNRCLKGDFPGYKEGKFWRVEKGSLLRYIEQREQDAARRAANGTYQQPTAV